MKILLLAINTKYIHTNPAIYSLRAYAVTEAKRRERAWKGQQLVLREYTINHEMDAILRGVFEVHPQVLCISCYLWNIRMVRELVQDYRKLDPEVKIWLGGPEVSYDAAECLKELTAVDGIMVGEGEQTFFELADFYFCGGDKENIRGLTYRREDGEIRVNPEREPLDFSALPFPYEDMESFDHFEHKIIYYETSRGCPFSCCYCLSSVDKSLRFRAWKLVQRELQMFLDGRVAQVKFVDRTFNCNKAHAMRIWSYLQANDNGVTNFHFEIAADLLDDEQIELLSGMRPGYVQLEIGVQSTNPQTIAAICRRMDLKKVERCVARVHAAGNIHQHLDLIAGLPYEDYLSFGHSFDDVYRMRPNQLQLGFLKVLKGSAMAELVQEHEIRYKAEPPYEVLSTKYLSYREVLALKDIEEMVERYYNSGQYVVSLAYLAAHFERPFVFFEKLAAFYRKRGLFDRKQGRMEQFELLYRFAGEYAGEKAYSMDCVTQCLLYDLYCREKPKQKPSFAPPVEPDKEKLREMFAAFGVGKEHAGRCYVAEFAYDFDCAAVGQTKKAVGLYLFDYSCYDELTGMCKVKRRG